MVYLFNKCRAAHQFLFQNAELKKKWLHAIDWLQDELEKVKLICIQFRDCYMTKIKIFFFCNRGHILLLRTHMPTIIGRRRLSLMNRLMDTF